MKKFLLIFAVLGIFTSVAIAEGFTLDVDYGMPYVTWTDGEKSYGQKGMGFVCDYRFIGDTLGFQFTMGVQLPYNLSITNTSTGTTYDRDIQTDTRSWVTSDFFMGVSFVPVSTNLVDLVITPGLGASFDVITDKNDSFTNMNLGVGVDICTNVKIIDDIGITAGLLFEYQFVSIEDNGTTDVLNKSSVRNYYFLPRAGISISF